MMGEQDWIVEIRLAYTVKAGSPDEALGAVLPLVSLGRDRYGPQPEIADYTVREHPKEAIVVSTTDSTQGLTKAVYTAKEVAEILGMSVHTVYEKLPSMRIGKLHRYSRAAVLDVMEKGVQPKPPEVPERVLYRGRRRAEASARVTEKEKPKADAPLLSVPDAAKLLRLSSYKLRQLLDAKEIYHMKSGRKIMIPRVAAENFVNGLSPRAFVEARLREARDDPTWKDMPEELERFATEWRAEWPDDTIHDAE